MSVAPDAAAGRARAVLVAGSANLDFVVRAAHIPRPGETVLGMGFQTFPGGKGANQAVASARAGGADTRMLLALGDDPYALPLQASLEGAGVALHLVRSTEPTGTAFICVSNDAENAITVAPGANNALAAGHLPSLDGIGVLLLQLETPLDTVVAYAAAARVAGVTVVLNAAPARALPAALLALVDVLVVNEGELAAITGEHDHVAAGLERLDVPCVIVTLGARGCCARIDGQTLLQPAFAVEPVDTTAAGDTFCGTLAAALVAPGAARGTGPVAATTLQAALRTACAASALACTAPGAQSSVPTAARIAAFLGAAPGPAPDAVSRLAEYCHLAPHRGGRPLSPLQDAQP